MNFFVFALLIVAISAEFTDLKYRSCDHVGTILKVSAENFDVEEDGIKKVALFHVGNNPRIRIEFKPSTDATRLGTRIRAKINKSHIDFPQPGKNACNFGVQCPVTAGSTQTFIQEIEIQENQKSDNNIPVTWMITNEQGKHEVCITFLARVV